MTRLADIHWIHVPAGEFLMGGSEDDRFVNRTELPVKRMEMKAFEMMACPVIEWQWAKFAGGGPDSNLPVVGVSWEDACDFAEWLGDGDPSISLPTEAEWEYACRGGTMTPFSCGSMITPDDANFLYDEDGNRVGPGGRTPVGRYAPNAFGLHDMHGNVCEWTANRWRPTHGGPPHPDKVIRGGAWDLMPRLLRSSWRDRAPIDARRDNLGFRLVRLT
ncbi:formylglycine-generating enzyme family protein [Haloferula sargassicola]|uniref:Hercynine oxygenase n=1 Tax=Haloferula sargassicola TaxID=490096 RepID=A0ABP9UQM7_9BACT